MSMSGPMQRGRLGRGLASLIGDPTGGHPERLPAEGEQRLVSIEQIRSSSLNPRQTFDDAELDELAASIRERGLVQPIIARPVSGGGFEIVAGERRWRAAQKAQLHEVPVVVRTMGDLDALQLGLIENLQRADLSAIDEARGYRRLMTDFTQTQEDVAKVVGKSRPHVANTLRLLELPAPVQEMVQRGALSAGQARTLVGVPDALALAKRASEEKLSVRELERLRNEAAQPPPAAGGRGGKVASPASPKSADTRALERRIEEALGIKADLRLRGLGEQSVLTLEIRDFDQLDSVVDKLTRR